MAQNENITISAFPPPPPFYKLYLNYQSPSSTTSTPPHTVALKQDDLKFSTPAPLGSMMPPPTRSPSAASPNLVAANATSASASATPSSSMLQPLPPPLPPKKGSTFQMFGQHYSTTDVLPSLIEMGVEQLYPSGDIEPIKELKRLNRSIVFNYLQLLETLVENPAEYKTKVDDINLLFVNFHHLLNSYRPHQARETLISIMTEQIKQKKESITKINNTINSCKEILKKTLQTVNTEEISKLKQHVKQLQDIQNTESTTSTDTSNQQISPSTPTISIPTTTSSSAIPTTNNNDQWINDYLQKLSSIPRS